MHSHVRKFRGREGVHTRMPLPCLCHTVLLPTANISSFLCVLLERFCRIANTNSDAYLFPFLRTQMDAYSSPCPHTWYFFVWVPSSLHSCIDPHCVCVSRLPLFELLFSAEVRNLERRSFLTDGNTTVWEVPKRIAESKGGKLAIFMYFATLASHLCSPAMHTNAWVPAVGVETVDEYTSNVVFLLGGRKGCFMGFKC